MYVFSNIILLLQLLEFIIKNMVSVNLASSRNVRKIESLQKSINKLMLILKKKLQLTKIKLQIISKNCEESKKLQIIKKNTNN